MRLTTLHLLACAAAACLAAGQARAWTIDAPNESALITALRAEARAHELGEGMPKDEKRAVALYCEAARLGDSRSQLDLGWMYANGRGAPRDESLAAFFFEAAAEQGIEQARTMLRAVGGPTDEVPDCMREPAPPQAPRVARAQPNRPAPEILSAAPKPIVDLVKRLAPEYRLQPELVLAVIKVESNFDSVALSPKNAKGLMQLIPDTAARFGVRNPYDATQNIRGGMAYLRWLLAYFEGDLTLVTAAYNAGEGAVERYRGVPPYLETRAYVYKVLRLVGGVEHPYDATVASPSSRMRAIRAPRAALR